MTAPWGRSGWRPFTGLFADGSFGNGHRLQSRRGAVGAGDWLWRAVGDRLCGRRHDGLWNDSRVSNTFEPALVPELLVANLDRSIEFWCDACGFEIHYSRPDERFAYVALGSAHLMLEQAGVGRNWVTGSLERPLGRGVNFQVTVPDSAALAKALRRSNVELFMQPETKWYLIGKEEAGVHQFLAQDPDGYLVRFQSSVGRRSTAVSGIGQRTV